LAAFASDRHAVIQSLLPTRCRDCKSTHERSRAIGALRSCLGKRCLYKEFSCSEVGPRPGRNVRDVRDSRYVSGCHECLQSVSYPWRSEIRVASECCDNRRNVPLLLRFCIFVSHWLCRDRQRQHCHCVQEGTQGLVSLHEQDWRCRMLT
ncbi:hypothetical protein KCU76_g21, partial [Aureobasidium melanogenum]